MELREYLRGLRRHWIAILLLTLVGIGAAWSWTLTQARVYEASASAFISTADVSESIIPGQGNALARSYVPSFMDLATWRSVADHAIDELELETTPQELINQITITNPPETAVLKVSARAETGAAAEQLSGAWVRGLQATIDEVNGTGSPGSAPVNVFLGDAASSPTSPIYPDVTTALVVGGIIGFGFGVAFALVRTASDRRIRPSDPIHERIGLPVVGMLPVVDRDGAGRTKGGRGEHFAYGEALRSLRTNLQFMDVDNPPRTIVITSPMPGDGKSLTACELAKTLAAAGTPVILVDGDLRRSKVAKNMGLPGGVGLTDVLAGRARLEDVLQRTADTQNLLVLTAGTTPPNPSEMLGSSRMRALLGEMAEVAIVIIDAPPLLPVTDGAVLAHQADGALLVLRSGQSTYDIAEKALEALQRAHGRALGVVLNRMPLRGVDASPYAHAYRYDYSDAQTADQSSDRPPRQPKRTSERRTSAGVSTTPL